MDLAKDISKGAMRAEFAANENSAFVFDDVEDTQDQWCVIVDLVDDRLYPIDPLFDFWCRLRPALYTEKPLRHFALHKPDVVPALGAHQLPVATVASARRQSGKLYL
jgi:hypothetical protein